MYTNTYSYDSADRLSAIGHNGFAYTFTYDAFGNTKTTGAGGHTLITNEYGACNGKLLSSTYGNGDTVQYGYDDYERLSQENRDGSVTRYTYNRAGQLTQVTDATGKYTYYYDTIGRVTRMVYPDGGNLKITYDANNRLTAVHTNLGGTQRTTSYEYLTDGRVSQVELPTGKAVTYSYDPLARLSAVGIDGIVNTSYTYESAGAGKTTPQVSSVTTNGKKTEYTYDAWGNILTITEDGVLVSNPLPKELKAAQSDKLCRFMCKTYQFQAWKGVLYRRPARCRIASANSCGGAESVMRTSLLRA